MAENEKITEKVVNPLNKVINPLKKRVCENDTVVVNKRTKNKHINRQQKDILIEFLENHPELKSGKFSASFTMSESRRLWEEVSVSLNSIPSGSNKSPMEWKRAWQDMKKNAKAKSATIKQHKRGTGGGEKLKLELNENENRVCELLGETAIAGHSAPESTVEFEFPNDTNNDMAFESTDIIFDNSMKQLTNLIAENASENPTALAEDEFDATTSGVSKLATVQSAAAVQQLTKSTREPKKNGKPRLVAARRLDNTILASTKLAEIGQTKNSMKADYYGKKIKSMEREVAAIEAKNIILSDVSNSLKIICEVSKSKRNVLENE